jgi:hypothetical protein
MNQRDYTGSTYVETLPKIDITKPRWDQSTYGGRVRHFFNITNPLNTLKSDAQLDEARRIVERYK